MSVYPFYDKYRIDDSNIWCHRVIYADCDGIHKYKTICELVKECTLDQLKNPCIVDFLNSDLSKKSGQYVKVWPNGCFTTDIPECPCDDKKVGATNQDNNPWPLIDKLIGNCDPTHTYCIGVSSPSPNVVQVTPSGPINWFTQFKGNPLCDEAIVKMNKKGEVYTVCPDVKPWTRFLMAVHKWGDYTQNPNTTERIRTPAKGTTGSTGLAGFSGGWNFQATDGFAIDDSDQTFLIEEDGLYYFAFSMYTNRTTYSVHAIRAGIFVNGLEVWDWKYEGGRSQDRDDYDWYAPIGKTPERYKKGTEARAIPMEWLNFGNSIIIPIKWASKANPVWVSLQLKPDLRTMDPRFTYGTRDAYPKVTYHIEGDTSERGPPTTIYCYKVDELPRLKELR